MFDQVILLTGMPRSGTSWLSQIFDSSPDVRFRLSPLFSFEFKNQLTEQSSKKDWMTLLCNAYESDNEFMNQTARRNAGEYPVFKIKHSDPKFLLIKDTRFHNLTARMLELVSKLTVIALIRHPCGAINSWLKSPKEFPATADPKTEWRNGNCRKTEYGEYWGFEDWKRVTKMHLDLQERYPTQVRLQRYEDLVRDPQGETSKLFRFCGISNSDQSKQFLVDSRSLHIQHDHAVFKDPSVARSWMEELDPEIRDEIISELSGTDLERFAS